MSALCLLLWVVILIEYMLISNRYDDMKLFGLVLFCSSIMFWLCQRNRFLQAYTLSSVLATILLCLTLLYLCQDRTKLFLKMVVIIILLTINNV
jgi:hypothetical protein